MSGLLVTQSEVVLHFISKEVPVEDSSVFKKKKQQKTKNRGFCSPQGWQWRRVLDASTGGLLGSRTAGWTSASTWQQVPRNPVSGGALLGSAMAPWMLLALGLGFAGSQEPPWTVEESAWGVFLEMALP